MAFRQVEIAAIGAFVVFLLYRLSRIGRRSAGLPPGPPTLPLLGNLHLMPKEKTHLQFQKWAKEYGPIYSLILGTKVVIVLSADDVVKDLLDKRSAIYSSRPILHLGFEILGKGLRLGFMPYGERWRKIRGIMHKSFTEQVSQTYVPYMDLETKALLVGLLEKPNQFFDHFKRASGSVATQIAYGFRTTSPDDPRLKKLVNVIDKWSELAASQTAGLVDVYPVLRRLPDIFLPEVRYAKSAAETEYELYVGHYLTAKKKLKEGKLKPCFSADLACAQKELGLADDEAAYMSSMLLEAGTDTTSSTLFGFVHALLLYPEVVERAQAEIDRVCSDGRMPDLSDAPNMPYLRGCVKESLRWMPTAILSAPHAVIRDDEYRGYHIPKDTRIVLNVWTINHDGNRYLDPERFDPSRWEHNTHSSAESARSADPTQRDHFGFGAGRRICIGIHVADRNLFLSMARLLWAFDVRRPIDPVTGAEMIPKALDLTEGLLVHPLPFPADIRPRSEERAAAIRAEWEKTAAECLDAEGEWQKVPEGMVWRESKPDASYL